VERKQEPQEVVQNRGVYAGGGGIWRWMMTRERSKELKAVSMLTGVSFGMEINLPSERRICAGSIGTLVE
jgi:hypothetical protein